MDDDVIDPMREIRETGEFPIFCGDNMEAGIRWNRRKTLYFPPSGDTALAKVPLGDGKSVSDRREKKKDQAQ